MDTFLALVFSFILRTAGRFLPAIFVIVMLIVLIGVALSIKDFFTGGKDKKKDN